MKDYTAFSTGFGICYIPESGDTEYDREDYLEMAKGNVDLAEVLFGLSDWQHPETILEEMIAEGEVDEQGNILIDYKTK